MKILLISMLGLAISTGLFAEESMQQDEYGRWVNSAGGNIYGDSRWNPDADPNWNPNADPKWNSDADPMK
jgi:hypothetical protein